MHTERAYRVGIDIGGTFTDFTIVDDGGRVLLWKEDTTPADPTRAILAGLDACGEQLGVDTHKLLQDTALFVHGTTAATNAVIQRNGPTVGLLCTRGFRDILYFRDGFKPERFNIHLEHPRDFVPRFLRLGITERISQAGEVLVALDESEVRAAAAQLRGEGVDSVAVAFLWSIVNPAHERRALEVLREELPGVDVVISSDVLPEIREWERTSATVLSAYILPVISAYMQKLESTLRDLGLDRPLLVMQINGGCASVDEVMRKPVNALHSGPAAAPAAAAWYARELGVDDLITMDMGGTSLDVCVIAGGHPSMSRTIQVDGQPVGVPGVEVQSIGAGGGSIAWVDKGGALRVGPRSAGASPGPACYGDGGTRPTVTDANVVLGYLEPEAFLGGRRKLRADLAAEAIRRDVAEPLGLTELEAAAGILRVVNANMLGAIRGVSVERGVDPRGFMLVAGGGAGAIHAAALARTLGIERVLVPREAGTFCAFGMTVTDVRHDRAYALRLISRQLETSAIDAVFAQLETEASERLREDGFTADQIVLHRYVDARYPGQVHELTIPIPSVPSYGEAEIAEIEQRFHDSHRTQFTYARNELPVEFLHWRVSAFGRMDALPGMSAPGADGDYPPATRTREVYFEQYGRRVQTRVHTADALARDALVAGPAVIDAPTTTIVVNPGDVLTVRENGSFVIDVAVRETPDATTDAQVEATQP